MKWWRTWACTVEETEVLIAEVLAEGETEITETEEA